MFKKTRIRYNNAKLVISQIRAGEWTPSSHHDGSRYYTASRGKVKIWLANGPFFCEGFIGDVTGSKGLELIVEKEVPIINRKTGGPGRKIAPTNSHPSR